MKILTIYTRAYGQALQKFASEMTAADILSVRSFTRRESLYCLKTGYMSARLADALAPLLALLTEVAMQENPVYKYSAKLKAFAQNQEQTALHTENLLRLKRYLRENNRLHLEGYVMFCMADYREMLDTMMFLLLKKWHNETT